MIPIDEKCHITLHDNKDNYNDFNVIILQGKTSVYKFIRFIFVI